MVTGNGVAGCLRPGAINPLASLNINYESLKMHSRTEFPFVWLGKLECGLASFMDCWTLEDAADRLYRSFRNELPIYAA